MGNALEQHLLKHLCGGGRRQQAAVIVRVGRGDGEFGKGVTDARERDPFEAGDRSATRHSVSFRCRLTL